MLLLWFNYCNRAEKDVNLALIYNTKWSLKSSIDGENKLSKSKTKYSFCDRESQFTIPKLIKFFWNLYYQDKNAKIKKKKYLSRLFFYPQQFYISANFSSFISHKICQFISPKNKNNKILNHRDQLAIPYTKVTQLIYLL